MLLDVRFYRISTFAEHALEFAKEFFEMRPQLFQSKTLIPAETSKLVKPRTSVIIQDQKSEKNNIASVNDRNVTSRK